MDLFEIERGSKAINLESVEAIEKLTETHTKIVTEKDVYVVALPYWAILKIFIDRSKKEEEEDSKEESNSAEVMKILQNMDNNTNGFRG